MLNLFFFPVSHQLGEHHEKTKESSEYLKYLTQQAVALQRTMNEIYKNGSNANIMPLKVPQGSGTVLCHTELCPAAPEGHGLSGGMAVVPSQAKPC